MGYTERHISRKVALLPTKVATSNSHFEKDKVYLRRCRWADSKNMEEPTNIISATVGDLSDLES